MAEQPSPTWNFQTGSASEMAFFKRGERMIMEAKEQYAGELKGLKFKKKADIKALQEERKKGLKLAVGPKAKAAIRKKYKTDLAALNKEYKKSFADLRIERKENIDAGKAATAEAFRTGYLPPTPEEQQAAPYTSQYAEELGQLQIQNDSTAEAVPDSTDLLAILQKGIGELTGALSGETVSAFENLKGQFTGVGTALEGVSGTILDQFKEQQKTFFDLASEAKKSAATTDAKTQLAIQKQTDKQAELAAKQLEQDQKFAQDQLDQQQSLADKQREQSAAQFAQQYSAQQTAFEAQQEALMDQLGIQELSYEQQVAADKARQQALSDQLKLQQKSYEQQGTAFTEQQKTLEEQLGIQRQSLTQQGAFQEEYMKQLAAQQARETKQFQEESAQFAAQFGLQEQAVGLQRSQIAQQEAMMIQQRELAEAEAQREEAAFNRQMVRFRNQARENLTPELQIQPGAQGLNIGGTSMFKSPGVRVRTNTREQINPLNIG
jgi:hypothetical protein